MQSAETFFGSAGETFRDHDGQRVSPPPVAGRSDAWRPLGKILVDRGLISSLQLRAALREQTERGGRLGEILFARGWVSPIDLRDALAEQHGLDLRVEPWLRRATPAEGLSLAVPLGQLLVRRGCIDEDELADALLDQARTGRRLGQILLEQRAISAAELAAALAEQDGLLPASHELEIAVEGDPVPRPASYQVRETVDGEIRELFLSPRFLDATDLAFAVLEEWEPAKLDVVKITPDEAQEVCWHYPPAA